MPKHCEVFTEEKVNDRVTKAAKFMYLAAFFCLWTGNFATRCHKVKFIVEGGTVLGNRAGSQELIQLGEQTKEKRQPFNSGDFCRESRDQCQHSEPH